MASRSREHHSVRCPRCGYDQRGVVSTWKETCPLQGTCTECGLEFIWCEVLRPEKFEPRWCVEFVTYLSGVPWASCKTLARSFWPWAFWSRLQMAHRIRWLRLAMYALLLPLVLLLPAYVAAQAMLALSVRAAMEQQLLAGAQAQAAQLQAYQAHKQQMIQNQANMGMSDEQFAILIQQIDAQIAALQQAVGTPPPHIDKSALITTLEAIFLPLASESSASIILKPGTTQPYVAPIRLFTLATQLNYRAGDAALHALLVCAWLAWGVAMAVLLPLSFILLPFSRRRAKVRWSHIARVMIYSAFIPLLCVIAGMIALGSALVQPQMTLAVEREADIARYVPWIAIALWWHAATSCYFKIPHAWLTIGMLTLMCLLLLLGITAAISHELAWAMLDLFEPLIR